MANVIYEQAIIRAQLSILSNPPVAPIDINTGLAPQFWRAAGIAIEVGIFDGGNVGLDLSNLSYLQLSLQPSSTSLVPWVTKQVLAVGLASPIEYGSWLDGLTENASFVLTPADTDLGLLAEESRQFWMEISGYTQDGNFIVYGAGNVTIYNPGSTLVNPNQSVTSYHSQTNASGNSTITPTSPIHTEVINLGGSAGTRNILIPIAGITGGMEANITFNIPATSGIVVNVYSGTISGSPIQSFTTTGTSAIPQAQLNCYYNTGSNTWVARDYQGPIP